MPEGVSIIKMAEKRIAAAKADMGTLQLPEVPEKCTQKTDEQGYTNEGEFDANGKLSGYGVSMHPELGFYVGEWVDGKI